MQLFKIVFIVSISITIGVFCTQFKYNRTSLSLRDAHSTLTSDSTLFFFNGKVSRGEMFQWDCMDGLTFRLVPYQHNDSAWIGWTIWIGNKLHPEECYNCVVTPPYHGTNAIDIAGWHFRNSDNSGSNEAGKKNVNASQYERQFCFVLNQHDYQIAFESLNEPFINSEEDRKKIRDQHQLLKTYQGKLNITGLDLGNLVINKQARIEYMEFSVELNLTAECE